MLVAESLSQRLIQVHAWHHRSIVGFWMFDLRLSNPVLEQEVVHLLTMQIILIKLMIVCTSTWDEVHVHVFYWNWAIYFAWNQVWIKIWLIRWIWVESNNSTAVYFCRISKIKFETSLSWIDGRFWKSRAWALDHWDFVQITVDSINIAQFRRKYG